MEFLNSLIDLLMSAEFYALVVALTTLLVAVGKALQAIGNLRNKSNADEASGKILWVAGEIGKFAEWLAPGNADEKNHPEILKSIKHLFGR